MLFRSLALLGVIAVSGLALRSQTFSSRKDFFGLGKADYGLDITELDMGYFVLGLGHDSLYPTLVNAAWTKLDLSGTIQQEKAFARDSVYYVVGHGNTMDVSNSGNRIFCGSSDSSQFLRTLVWKLNSNGDSIFAKPVYSINDTGSTGFMAKWLPDGSIIAVGAVWHTGPNHQYFLAKLDSLGNVLWKKTYGGPWREECWSVDLALDGGFILGGYKFLEDENNPDPNADGWIIKTDANGNVQWQKLLGGQYEDGPTYAMQCANGEFMAAGTWTDYANGAVGRSRLYAARLDLNGDTLWTRRYGASQPYNEIFTTKELPDGKFIACGLYVQTNGGLSKGCLLKYAANGDSLWLRTYQHPGAGLVSYHELRDVVQTSDGGYAACGMMNDSLGQDLWVIRVDSFGCLVPGCQMYDHIAEQGLALHVGIYPNPASERLYISFRSGAEPTGTFKVVDSEGRVVRVFSPGGRSEEMDLDVREMKVGLYLLQYEDKKGTRWTEKFMRE